MEEVVRGGKKESIERGKVRKFRERVKRREGRRRKKEGKISLEKGKEWFINRVEEAIFLLSFLLSFWCFVKYEDEGR